MCSRIAVAAAGLLCSCHGSVFDYRTGEPLSPPATRPITVFPVREEDGRIWVGIDDELAKAATRRRATGSRRLSSPSTRPRDRLGEG